MQTRGTVVAVPAPVCPCVSLSIWLPSFGLHNRLTCQATEREMHRQKTPPPHTLQALLSGGDGVGVRRITQTVLSVPQNFMHGTKPWK